MIFSIILLLLLQNVNSAYTKQAIEQLMFILSLNFEDFSTIDMLEFGDQVFIGNFPLYFEPFIQYNFTNYIPSSGTNLLPSKLFFEHIGMKHTSLDINGNNGAISMDARYDLTKVVNKQFNMITNLGFSEHVGEQDLEIYLYKNQYAIFKNLHDFGTNGTVYYHMLPRTGHWNKHGVVDYEKDFFYQLIYRNQYEIIIAPTYIDKHHYKTPKNNIIISYIKVNNNPFMPFDQFQQLHINSKYSQYNIRSANLSFSDGFETSITVDVTTQSLTEEVDKFCELEILGYGLKDEVELCNGCKVRFLKTLMEQRIDGEIDIL